MDVEESEINQSGLNSEQQLSPEIDSKDECRGEVMIGPDDPGNMLLEEFKNSPHLLYHGALFHFQIDRNWTTYYVNEESSLISGSGFYTTPSKTEAEHYSSVRQTPLGSEPKENVVPVILEVMPYQAKMYDFTTGNNPEKLGVAPDSFFQEYLNFLRNIPEKLQSGRDIPDWLKEINKYFGSWRCEYIADILENISKGMVVNIPPKITINELHHDDYQNLHPEPETGIDFIDEENREKTKDYTIDDNGRYRTKEGKYIVEHKSERHGGELLRLFLQSKGYDGIISAVRGDNPKVQQKHLEYVFFPSSLNKIGTYDQWKEE